NQQTLLALPAGGPLPDLVHTHPPSTPSRFPLPRLPPALDPGPAVAGLKHLRELVHPMEVLGLVAGLAREQPHVNEREVAAGPGELGPAQVPAGRQLVLGVLERGEHEQVRALVVAAVAAADRRERLLERGEVAHGRASAGPATRTPTPAPGRGRGSSSACASTSSIVSTGVMTSSRVTSSGTS